MNIVSKKNNTLDMSIMLKSNSRFSSLIDDIPDKKNKKENISSENRDNKLNSFKSEKINETSCFRPYDDKQRERHRQERESQIKSQREFQEKEKDRKKMESLSMKNFPDLLGNIKTQDIINEKLEINSYIEKLMKEEVVVEKNIDQDLVNLKPGWILLKNDKITGTTIRKLHPETEYKKEEEKYEKDIDIEIVNTLVELHERRTNEFIELNGYDAWEKMFKFPNWQEEENYSESDTETEEDYDDM